MTTIIILRLSICNILYAFLAGTVINDNILYSNVAVLLAVRDIYNPPHLDRHPKHIHPFRGFYTPYIYDEQLLILFYFYQRVILKTFHNGGAPQTPLPGLKGEGAHL